MKKLFAVLGVAAVLTTVAAGGKCGLALGDPNPTFGKKVFIQLTSKYNGTPPQIATTCVQSSASVLADQQSASGGGVWVQLGPTATWTAGGATCTASLLTATHSGWKVQGQLVFGVSG